MTTGPVIRLTVNGREPGATIRLPRGGGEIEFEAELVSPHPLQSLMVLLNGRMIESSGQVSKSNSVYRILLRQRLRIRESGWLAAQGMAAPVDATNQSWPRRPRVVEAVGAEPGRLLAHTGVVRILVEDEPIGRPEAIEALVTDLTDLKSY